MINRYIYNSIKRELNQQNPKVVAIYGPRQVGKTQLAKMLLVGRDKVLIVNAEDVRFNSVFSSQNLETMMNLIEDHETIFIDEAQQIQNVGINLKILHDAKPNLKIIVTGSSSFEIANKIQEPLTGRVKNFFLFPLCMKELNEFNSGFQLKERRNEFLIFGLYPEIYTTPNKLDKIDHLLHLGSSYLYKDIFQLTNIKYNDKIVKLTQLLALQIGSILSINKLANALNISHETVENYIDLLEKSFVIFRLSAFSRNKVKEISKSDKFYFYDLGIRNAIINNFTGPDSRTDLGMMWENFVIAERMKKLAYERVHKQRYFWRTYNGSEIDYIEEQNGILEAFEIKYSNKIKKVPVAWSKEYGDKYNTINFENWFDWVL